MTHYSIIPNPPLQGKNDLIRSPVDACGGKNYDPLYSSVLDVHALFQRHVSQHSPTTSTFRKLGQILSTTQMFECYSHTTHQELQLCDLEV